MWNADADRYFNGNTDSHIDVDIHADANPNTHTLADPDRVAKPDANPHANPHHHGC